MRPTPNRRVRVGVLVLLLPWALAAASPPGPGPRSAPPGLPLLTDTLVPTAGTPALPVEEFTLGNGMRFLVLRRASSPTVSFVLQYGVGGVNERLGTTGTAHLLEHLLFKGTSTLGTTDVVSERRLFRRMDAAHDTLLSERGRPRPDSARLVRLRRRIDELEDSARSFVVPNAYDRILSREGARGLNATTASEATTYFVELPANRTELWFALESQRMADPVFREFYAERDVVMEERRLRVETNPGGRLYEAHLAAAFTMHPYGVPVVGYMSDLEVLERRTVADFYRRYYGPTNAVVAVVGDVDPARVRDWAEAYFGPLPPGERPPPVLAQEPPQEGLRRVELVVDAEPSLRMGWKVPEALHPDTPALVMLSALLTGGRTSRLYDTLVDEERLATFVAAGMGPGERFPRLFSLDAAPRAPHTPAEVEARIVEILAEMGREPVSEAALERVRTQVTAGRVRRLRSNLGLALQLAGSAATYGDWRTTFTLADQIQEVTAEDVRRVAERYFTPEGLTVATLVRREDREGS